MLGEDACGQPQVAICIAPSSDTCSICPADHALASFRSRLHRRGGLHGSAAPSVPQGQHQGKMQKVFVGGFIIFVVIAKATRRHPIHLAIAACGSSTCDGWRLGRAGDDSKDDRADRRPRTSKSPTRRLATTVSSTYCMPTLAAMQREPGPVWATDRPTKYQARIWLAFSKAMRF